MNATSTQRDPVPSYSSSTSLTASTSINEVTSEQNEDPPGYLLLNTPTIAQSDSTQNETILDSSFYAIQTFSHTSIQHEASPEYSLAEPEITVIDNGSSIHNETIPNYSFSQSEILQPNHSWHISSRSGPTPDYCLSATQPLLPVDGYETALQGNLGDDNNNIEPPPPYTDS